MKVIQVIACPKHVPHGIDLITTGPVGEDPAESEKERLMNVLMCRDCWEKDEPGLLELCKGIELSDLDIRILRSHVLG